jgi:hypothetical protein
MPTRSAARGLVLAVAGTAAVVALAVALTPGLRRRAVGMVTRRTEPEPQQPTHIVLPDRMPESDWGELDEAVEEGRAVGSGDVALTGA